MHSGGGLILTATGPGSEARARPIENTEVFRIMAERWDWGERVGAAESGEHLRLYLRERGSW